MLWLLCLLATAYFSSAITNLVTQARRDLAQYHPQLPVIMAAQVAVARVHMRPKGACMSALQRGPVTHPCP